MIRRRVDAMSAVRRDRLRRRRHAVAERGRLPRQRAALRRARRAVRADGIDVKAALTATERKNLSTFGYGVKSFAISMVEAAITITGGRVPSTVIAELVELVADPARGAGAPARPRARGARRGRRDAYRWS